MAFALLCASLCTERSEGGGEVFHMHMAMTTHTITRNTHTHTYTLAYSFRLYAALCQRMKIENSVWFVRREKKEKCRSLPKKKPTLCSMGRNRSLKNRCTSVGLYRTIGTFNVLFLSSVFFALVCHPFPPLVIFRQPPVAVEVWSVVRFDNPAVTEPALILYLPSRTLYVHRMIHSTILSTVQTSAKGLLLNMCVFIIALQGAGNFSPVFRKRTRLESSSRFVQPFPKFITFGRRDRWSPNSSWLSFSEY